VFNIFPLKDLNNATDEALISGIKSGNEAAFTILYERYNKKLFRYLLRLLKGDKEKAEDCLQDLFIKILSAASFDAKQKASTWLYTIATNISRSYWRNQLNRERLMQDFEPWENSIPKSINDRIDDKIVIDRINHILNALEGQDNEIILLRFHQELTIKEIAAVLNIPEGTVKSRIFYLLKKISMKIKAYQQA
jgi:RNA polymerase sigma-70 factor (ECF subfamily)